MRSIVVLLAATLLGADRPNGPEGAQISYELKILEMEGLGWRSALHSQLTPVARQGPSTVWTASRETANKLADRAARVVDAPSVMSEPQVAGSVFKNSTRKIVCEVTREADGPVDHASFVGFVPCIEDATEGYTARLTGRSIDQGVLATLNFENRQITTVHAVPVTESVEPKAGQAGEKTPVKATIQIPEYARSTVSGEWLIPKGGVLVVSLGVHTAADARGKAVVRERLVVVEAESSAAGQSLATTASPLNMNVSQLRGVSFSRPVGVANHILPAPTPAVPGRSLPQGLNANGQPVPLPPLPEFEAPVTMLPGTDLPCPSEQNGIPSTALEPIPWKKSELRDTETRQAGFSPGLPVADDKAPACPELPAAVNATSPAPAPAWKGFKFAVPLGGSNRIEVEVKSRPTQPYSSVIGERH